MTLLAVTIVAVWLTTPTCADDELQFSPVAAADLAGYVLSLDGANIANLPPQATSYPLACLAGRACLKAVDTSGNASAATCMTWGPDPETFWEPDWTVYFEVQRSCRIGCKPARSGACCVAPLSILP